MDTIKSFLKREQSHFHKLSIEGQKLLISISVFTLISPIFSLFMNAFIWRQSHEFSLVSFFNIVTFAGIPLGFYLNGFLLRRWHPNHLYTFGLALGGIIITTLIFLPSLSFLSIGLYGFVYGIASGIFWANRNLLTLKTTVSNDRIYFSGIESILSTISKIFTPFLIGWFIVLGSQTGLYSELTGYKITAIIMLLVTAYIGFLMTSFSVKTIQYKQITLKNVGEKWQKFRLLQIILGFLQAITSLLPTLMVLTLMGKENVLGTVQSVASILTAFVVYKLAKSLNVKHRLALLQLSFFLGLVGALAFSVTYSGIGVLAFYACQAFSAPLLWIATSSLNYDLIDEDKNDQTHYAYVTDQEWFLNGGRVAALIIFMIVVHFTSNDTALRFTPLLFAFSQVFLSVLAKSIERRKS